MEKNNKKGKELEKEKDFKTRKISVAMVVIFFLIAIIFTFCMVAIRIDATNNPEKIKNSSIEYKSEYKIKNNSLSDFDLYFLKQEKNNANKIYSPLSLKYALGMLYEASEGDSRGQLEAIIGDYNYKKYNNSKHVSFANALFIKDSYSNNIKNSYVLKVKDKFDAAVKYDSFKNAKNINKWISDNTFGLINNALDDKTVSKENFELINSLAIDMAWNRKIQNGLFATTYLHENFSHYLPIYGIEKQTASFNGKDVDVLKIAVDANKYNIVDDLGEVNIRNTIIDAYNDYLNSGNVCDSDKNRSVKEVVSDYLKELKGNYNTLNYSTDFYFLNNDDVKVFAKDLKKYDGRTLQYVSIMPKNKSLNQFISETSVDEINNYIDDMKDLTSNSFKEGVITKLEGNIPIFNYDYELALENDLKSMGIVDVFTDKAELGLLLKSNDNFINSAIHKTNINFSNDGIKAAATTSFGGAGAVHGCFDYSFDVPVETIDLSFDNPFMYIIRDKDTNEIWFIGTVVDLA